MVDGYTRRKAAGLSEGKEIPKNIFSQLGLEKITKPNGRRQNNNKKRGQEETHDGEISKRNKSASATQAT